MHNYTNRVLRLVRWDFLRYDYDLITYIALGTGLFLIKVHCNLRFLDKLEEIIHNNANIEWSSDDDSE